MPTGLEGMDTKTSNEVADQDDGVLVEKVKLLKVMTSFYSGGTEGQVLNLTRRIERRRFDLQFACLRKGGDILHEFEKLDIPITEFQIKNLYSPSTIVKQLHFARFMRAQKTQIVHSYNFYSNVFTIPAAKIAGVPVVIASIRDQGVYLTSAQEKVQKWVCGLADKILVNSDSIRKWLLRQGYAEDKIEVIKNGIDLSRYNKVKGQSGIREELGIPAAAPIILMLSRLNAQKGVEDFIDAAVIVNKSHPEIRFLIVGAKLHYADGVFSEDMDYVKTLRMRAEAQGIGTRVIFTGLRKDVPEILAESTISVLPSYSEGLSNTLLESMAAGVPVVTTNVGGNPELIADDVNGFLVPVKSPHRLAQALLRIVEDSQLAARFAEKTKKIATQYFSLEKMTLDTQSIYHTELRKSKRQHSAK